MATLVVAGGLAVVAAGIALALLGGPQRWQQGQGLVRELLLFALAFFPIMWVVGRRIGPALIARYDGAALRPWPPVDPVVPGGAPSGGEQAEVWRQLEAWCFNGAGSGASPFLRPWRMPDVPARFSVAVLTGSKGAGKSRLALALALGRDLDGTLQLEACASRWGGLWLRLRVKLQDCCWWRARQRSDPWDGGYLAEDTAGRAAIAAFSPRRATLIVADGMPQADLIAAIETLIGRRAHFWHPVRLLIIDKELPSALGLQWNAERGVWTSSVPELGVVPVIERSEGG